MPPYRSNDGMSRRAMMGGMVAITAPLSLSGGAWGKSSASSAPPLVFAHRGASALRPEHSLAAYAKAIEDGADYIEPDIVSTKDGVLVVRHENNITDTTDVRGHPEFAGRFAVKMIDGEAQQGWFTEDFTLAELKTLRVVERLGDMRPESRRHDGRYPVATLQEVIDFAGAESRRRGRTIGLVPELKHSTYFAEIGLPLEDRFLATVAAHDVSRRHPLEIQSFETANLRYLRKKIGHPSTIRIVQLVYGGNDRPQDVAATGGTLTYDEMMTPAGLAAIAAYADVLGPSTRDVIPLNPDGRLGLPSPLVRDAHAAGLLVRPWTFRPENHFLAADFRNDEGDKAYNPRGSEAEIMRYLATGIDGFFTDDPAVGRAAVARYLASLR